LPTAPRAPQPPSAKDALAGDGTSPEHREAAASLDDATVRPGGYAIPRPAPRETRPLGIYPTFGTGGWVITTRGDFGGLSPVELGIGYDVHPMVSLEAVGTVALHLQQHDFEPSPHQWRATLRTLVIPGHDARVSPVFIAGFGVGRLWEGDFNWTSSQDTTGTLISTEIGIGVAFMLGRDKRHILQLRATAAVNFARWHFPEGLAERQRNAFHDRFVDANIGTLAYRYTF
jgi:hypothetical protein